jgi:nucleoside-diphosphate-sugar epimerase
MKILLTGASGYVGGWIASELTRRGMHWKPLKSRLQALRLDCIEGSDTVIHCAAEHRDQAAITDQLIWETNLIGTENLLKACKDAGVNRFIYISTIIAKDKGVYAESKLAAENIVRKYDIDFTIFRPGQLFGPCEKFYHQLNDLKKLNWKYRVVLGKGDNQLFPTAYVKDFAAACVDAAQSSQQKKTFTFFDETITEIRYLRAARKVLNIKFLIIPAPKFVVRLRIGQENVNKWQRGYVFEKCDSWNYQPTPIEEILRKTYSGFLK